MRPKVVFDTNIFVSAIIFGGSPRLCLELVRAGDIRLVTSRAILLELAKVLQRKFNWGQESIREAVAGMSLISSVVEPAERITAITADPSDNRILEAAVAANTDWIISGDKRHILSLGSFQKIQIVTAQAFILQQTQSLFANRRFDENTGLIRRDRER